MALTRKEMYRIMEEQAKNAPVEEIAYIVYDFKYGKAHKIKDKTLAQRYVETMNLQSGLYLLVTEDEWKIAQKEIASVEVEVPRILNLKDL